MQDQLELPELILTVYHQDLPFYTTLLQSGVEIKSSSNETMAHFLNRLPGFTMDYITDTVQTIFLNGTAVDDLTTKLGPENPVLAISAAMPGLAGAIFRRNSFHAALRTPTGNATVAGKDSEPTFVTLKLFNSIARERGTELLNLGVNIKTSRFNTFFTKRTALFEKIVEIKLSNTKVKKEDSIALLAQTKNINLRITTIYG